MTALDIVAALYPMLLAHGITGMQMPQRAWCSAAFLYLHCACLRF
jgi:hypothetical protein